MIEITIIRHGETTWNVEGKVQGQADPPLTQNGVEQAFQLAEKFRDSLKEYSIIYSSERQRALKVAEILKNGSSLSIKIDSRLSSRSLGKFSGMTLDEVECDFPILYKKWRSGDATFIPPNGDSTADLIRITQKFLASIKALHNDGEKIIVITHRENLGILHYLITGKKMDDPLRNIKNCTPYVYQLT
ncbi:histidine phosphatase family protein [Candidatus Lokiarchaeum ossiferum]|uniref:histidine phosphatase family protein n=1 Tax=Candidatus Lokiarchaeum ossiferum TaxID=2951803 RepID=UPI00352DC257